MKVLISNDDGIYAEGIWALARELSRVAEVVIVAPDREQSAVGTAVSLRKPLRVQKIIPLHSGVEAYSVEGTPSDSVIVGLGKVSTGKVDLVISGINQGSNMGEDVLISGTVGAALAGYLRGFPAMAISCDLDDFQLPYLNQVARLTTLLAERVYATKLPSNLFLNVNMPHLPIEKIKGLKITSLGRNSHVNTVEEGHDGKRAYYMLVREAKEQPADTRSDIWNTQQGYISVTPLHLFLNNHVPQPVMEKLISGVMEEFRAGIGSGIK